jgi:TPR repeat protein
LLGLGAFHDRVFTDCLNHDEEITPLHLARVIVRNSAQLLYRLLLATGDGISMDKSLAVHYYKLSADKGKAFVQFHSGRSFAPGDGISMNQ